MTLNDIVAGHRVYITAGFVSAVDSEKRTLTVETMYPEPGRMLFDVKILTSSVSPGGGGHIALPVQGAKCLVIVITNEHTYDAYVIGFVNDPSDEAGKELFQGDFAYFVSNETYFVLRRNGAIEISSNPRSKIVFKPVSKTLFTVFENYEFYKDPLNFIKFIEEDGKVTFELSSFSNLRDVTTKKPKEPEILFRIGALKRNISGDIFDEFEKDSGAQIVLKRDDNVYSIELSNDGLNVTAKDDDKQTTVSLQKDSITVDSNGSTLSISKDAAIASVGSGKSIVKDGSIAIGASGIELLEQLVDLVDEIINAPFIGLSQTGPVKLHPQLSAKLASIKSKIESIKGDLNA